LEKDVRIEHYINVIMIRLTHTGYTMISKSVIIIDNKPEFFYFNYLVQYLRTFGFSK